MGGHLADLTLSDNGTVLSPVTVARRLYMASDVYLRLVHRLGLTAEDFQRWLEATLAWRLLGIG